MNFKDYNQDSIQYLGETLSQPQIFATSGCPKVEEYWNKDVENDTGISLFSGCFTKS